MTQAALARLRDTCAVADLVLVDAQRILVSQPDAVTQAADRIANARRILHAGAGHVRPVARVAEPPALRRGDVDGLTRSFPALLRKGCASYADLEALYALDGACWSSGERQAALFVRHVVAGEPFDLANAINVWDERHHAAFLAWARSPWTGR